VSVQMTLSDLERGMPWSHFFLADHHTYAHIIQPTLEWPILAP